MYGAQAMHLQVERLAQCAGELGPAVHMESDYGDEVGGRTPWEIFQEADARHALSLAEEAVQLARQLIQGAQSP